MKLIAAALVLFFSGTVFGDELLCASKKDQSLYFTEGQIRLTARIANSTLLTSAQLSTTGNNNLGFRREDSQGRVNGKYVRFSFDGDPWCSYKMTLPKGFMTKSTTWAIVDAECEEGYTYELRLNCAIQ